VKGDLALGPNRFCILSCLRRQNLELTGFDNLLGELDDPEAREDLAIVMAKMRTEILV